MINLRLMKDYFYFSNNHKINKQKLYYDTIFPASNMFRGLV